ncbi:MAG: secretin N-terminal domain-containing protein [Parvibaculaceae bacterium]
MSKFTLPVTLACLLAVVALARGDEPAAVPAASKPTQAQATEATPEASTNSQPESAAPNVIIIETTPDLERSEVIGKLVEGLEKDGIAKRSDDDRAGKPVDFHAVINACPDLPGDKIRALIETLKALSIACARVQLIPADGVNDVIVTCPANVTYQRVRTLQETLSEQDDFKVDVRVAANIGPVTSTGPTMFTVPLPQNPLAPITKPAAAQGNGGEFGYGFGGGGVGGVPMGLPASAIPGRNWFPGTKVIVTFSDDGEQVLAYSEQHPRWVAQDLEKVADIKPLPVVGSGDTVAVRVGHLFYAYSPTLGKWDVLKLPPGELAVPMVSDDGLRVHSASQGDFVFQNSWGKWFSTDEIKAGKVAEFLQTRQATVPAAQALVDSERRIRIFHLENIAATDAARLVRQLYGEAINPVVDERTNSLVCKDAPSVLEEVEALLLHLDSTATKALDLPTSAQPVDDLRKLFKQLEQRTKEFAAQLLDPAENPAATKQLHEELRVLVRNAFEARQELQRAELAEFAQRLQGIQRSIEMRDRISQQIIERRVEELLDPNLKWDSADREGLLNPQSDSSSILSPLRVGQQILLKSQAGNYRITIMDATTVKAMEANAAEIGSTYEPDTVVAIGNDAIVVDKAGLKKVIPVSAIVEIRSMPDEDKKEPTEKLPSQNVGTREATSLDDTIKVFNEKYADNPFCRVQPELSPFEVTGAIRIALDRETSADLPANELAELRSIEERQVVPAGWQLEIYAVTQHVSDDTILQTSIGLTLIRSDGTASIHEIRRLLNEPADGTEDGELHVLGLYDVGQLPLWTRDGKKQNVELLLRYLKTNIDPPSWRNGTTRASYDAEKLRIYVWTTDRARHAEIARTLENWTPRLTNVSPHPPGYSVPHPIGDLPLWRRDGKGQEVDLLIHYLKSVIGASAWEDGKTYAWGLRTNNSLVVQANDEKQKKIADAISVLRVEMLLEHLATLVNDRDYAGYVDLLTDDEVIRLASVMSRDKTPLESPIANSQTPAASAEILKDKRQFIVDVLAASDQRNGLASKAKSPPNWEVTVEGDHAVATESTDEQAPTRIALTRVNGQWKISNLFGKDTIKGIGSGASHPSETPGIRVRVLLDAESYSQEILQQNMGFEGFSLLTSDVQRVEDQPENSTAAVATCCRLESFEEADTGGKKHWRTTIFVPQGSTVYESNLSLTQEKLDEMQERGVEFNIFPLRHHVESGLAGIVTEPVWGETVNGLQLGISGIREEQHFASGTTVRFNLLVRNAGSEPIRIQYSISKTGYWIAPTIVTEAGEQVRFNAMAFRGGHKTYLKTLEPQAMVGIEAPGIVVLGESKTANQYWPKFPNPQPGEYKLHAGFLFTRVDAEDKPLGKYITLTSGSVNFHIDAPKAVGADVTSGRANGQKLPDSPGADVKSD